MVKGITSLHYPWICRIGRKEISLKVCFVRQIEQPYANLVVTHTWAVKFWYNPAYFGGYNCGTVCRYGKLNQPLKTHRTFVIGALIGKHQHSASKVPLLAGFGRSNSYLLGNSLIQRLQISDPLTNKSG
nr:hypothetical protein [Shewanella zhangzhouensis]